MKNLIFLFLILFVFYSCKQNSVSIESPDKKVHVTFGINENNSAFYQVNSNGIPVITPSFMGFRVEGTQNIGTNLEIISNEKKTVNESWEPVYGERSEIVNHYNEAQIHLKETVPPNRDLLITFRVYNEGVAFNYSFLSEEKQQTIQIKEELTEFSFDKNYDCWVSDRAQSEYRKQALNNISEPAERPLVVEAGENFVALGEAKLIDFARMKLIARTKENSLVASLEGEANVTLPYTTPWRTIMVGKSPGELLENNFMVENLNDECAIKDVSWIKPGKVIREVTLTTRGGKACIDFAAENGLQYVEFDAGWYGHEYNEESDATTITVDPKRSPGPLDLHEIVDYANSKGIGIILYINRRALEKQIDEVLPLYQSWGIKGVKYGFVQVGSQEWTAWLHEAVKKAAEHKLMVDIHDEYRPTGFSRTYPNLMTQEGIRGDEEAPTNEHSLITLFTRMLAGAADNTNCYYAPRVQEKMGGNVSQLAKAVMLYSPWQFLFWYDRPPNSSDVIGGVPGSEDYIVVTPELDFFKQMPTVWDTTKVLEGEISKHATVARKTGNDWFLGSLTGNDPHQLIMDLSFLDSDSKYEATVYSYDPGSTSKTKVKIENKEVKAGSEMKFKIAANSGLAIHFQKL